MTEKEAAKGCNWNGRLFTKLLKPHIVNAAVDTVCIGYIFDDEVTALSQWTFSLLKSIKDLSIKLGANVVSSDDDSDSSSGKDKAPKVKVLVHDSSSKGSVFSVEHKKSSSSSSSSDPDTNEKAKRDKEKQVPPKNATGKKGTINTSTSSTSPAIVPPKHQIKTQQPEPKKVTSNEKPKQQQQIKKAENDVPKQKTTKISASARSTRATNINATPMRSSRKTQVSSSTVVDTKSTTKPVSAMTMSKRAPLHQEKSVSKPVAKTVKVDSSPQKTVGSQSLRPRPVSAHKPKTLLSQSQSQSQLTSKMFSQMSQPEKRQTSVSSPTVDERSSWEEREKYLLKRLHEVEGLYAAQRNENIRLRMAFEDLKSVTEKRLGDIKDRMAVQNEKYKQELLRYDSIVSNQASTIAELQRQFLKLYQTKLSSVVIRNEGIEDDEDNNDNDDDYGGELDRPASYIGNGGGKSFNNFCPCHTDMITLEKLVSQQSVDIKSLEKRLEASERNHIQQKTRYEEEIERLKKSRGTSYSKPGSDVARRLEAYKIPELEEVCGKVMGALDKCLDDLPHHESMDALFAVDRNFVGKSPDEAFKSLKQIRDILQIIITHIQIF